MDNTANNKRIAKNTVFLYIRMAFIMLITLYTSRIVLRSLGVTDYGIYNLVGGIATMFSFITSPMSGASNRFLSYELGKGNSDSLHRLFGTLRSLHIIVGVIVCVLLLALGPWFIYYKLVIPEGKMFAAICVFIFSTISVFIMVVCLPYNALIIAHEKMNAFAAISIFEVSMKLIIAYLITLDLGDKLIFYAFMLMLTNICVILVYTVYCRKHFIESKSHLCFDKAIARDVYQFGSWIILGNLAVVGFTQGINIVLNLFFGTVVNAARGIAVQVQGACVQFSNNFQTAFKPQIVKSYAVGDLNYTHKLIIYCSKYSFLIMLYVVVPLCYFTPYILRAWLGEYPAYTVPFVRIILMTTMIDIIKHPIIQALQATGDVKRFQIIEGSMMLTIVPIAYLGLKFGIDMPQYVFYVFFGVEIVTQIVRIYLILPKIDMPYSSYIKHIVFPLALVLIPIFAVFPFIPQIDNFFEVALYIVLTEIFLTVIFLIFAVPKSDRQLVLGKIRAIVRK